MLLTVALSFASSFFAPIALLAPQSSPPSSSGGSVAPPPPSGPAAVLVDGTCRVAIDESGNLLGVAGRELHVEKMHDVVAPVRGHSWIGIHWNGPNGLVNGVIPGDAPDYGGRQAALQRSWQATSDRFVALHRLDDVEIRVEFAWQPLVGALIQTVALTNVGTATLTDGLVWFEWQVPGAKGSTSPSKYANHLPPAPQDVFRMGLRNTRMRPGEEQEFTCVYRPDRNGSGPSSPATGDLPLRLWTSSKWPDGVNFGSVLGGVSTGDFDQDGWSDLFVCYTGGVFRNVQGGDWSKINDLDDEMGKAEGEGRYGSAICDYDNDGLPDIGSEPRAWTTWKFDLMRNEGFGQFRNVANDPGIIDVVPANGDCETLAVGDVDGDADLDWFLPAYPDWVFGGPGNFFLQNLGPAGPNGEYIFHEASAEAALDNPDGVNRPEGAELCDIDGDGDVDLYSNGTLYRNVSTVGTPAFEWLFGAVTGIVNQNQLDEGVRFLDYDMDGDLDLMISFVNANIGLRIFENRGDATWFQTAKTLFDANEVGTIFGCSAVDWDNDGDLDATSTTTFRPNKLIEDGARHFTVATHDIDEAQWGHGTPAWFDFDLDGDLDCAFDGVGGIWHLENMTYDPSTPSAVKRHVRVHVVRDDADLDRGLETEYGAFVSIDVLGAAADGRARVQQVTSSAGYLNQAEYILHFALPADPDPAPDADVRFALSVDFKGASSQGYPRVDRHVNPILGSIDLADLEAAGDREITVYRSGRVRIAGVDHLPALPAQPLTTTAGGLAVPTTTTTMGAPTVPPAGNWFVGAEFTTDPAAEPQRVEELSVDGTLAGAVDCSGVLANLYAWDVTDPAAPLRLLGGEGARTTPARNRRATVPLDFVLEPGRTYRIAARVSQLRATPIAGPISDGVVTTTGGLSFQDASPCDGVAIAAAVADPTQLFVSLRFRGEPAGAWADLGHGFAAGGAAPTLVGQGDLRLGSPFQLDLAGAPPTSPFFLVAGASRLDLPFAGGLLVPSLDFLIGGVTDAAGGVTFLDSSPDCLGDGESLFVQMVIVDPAAPHGFAFSNALAATLPY